MNDLRETAGAMLVRPDGKVLLGLRAPDKAVAPGLWDIVGGTVEPGESVGAALARELQEELGVEPIDAVRLATFEDALTYAPLLARHHVFAVRHWRGEPANLSAEHSEIRWFSIDEIERLPNRTPFDFFALYEKAVMATPGSQDA